MNKCSTMWEDHFSNRLVRFRHWDLPKKVNFNAQVSRFAWRRYENCWSPERLNYALICAEREAPPDLTGAVFAVGALDLKQEQNSNEYGCCNYRTQSLLRPSCCYKAPLSQLRQLL